MSSYCRVPGCNSNKRRVSCQGWAFLCFPVNSKVCREWRMWCLWCCCTTIKRLCLHCSSVLACKLLWAKLGKTKGEMPTSGGWNEYLSSKYIAVGHISECYGWLRYEGNNTGKFCFIDIICRAAVYCDYKYSTQIKTIEEKRSNWTDDIMITPAKSIDC